MVRSRELPDQVRSADDSVSSETVYYGYRFLITESRSDSTYHDRYRVRVEIREEGGEAALHVIERRSQSNHQLSKRYRAASSERDTAIAEAQQWVLANRPDASARQEDEICRSRRNRFEAVGRDPLAYLGACSLELSATEVGAILQLGTARKLNRLLCDWNLQRKIGNSDYEPVNRTHGKHVGLYGQLRWSAAGLKAIWDAAVRHRVVDGDDAEFVRRIGGNTDWLYFGDGDATDSSSHLAG
jgi:hypothetical protein